MLARFAPSPTGRLHLGHAYAALFAWRAPGRTGTCLLRIEDIDPDRCRPDYEQGIYDDLAWLGLTWPTPVRRQSQHMQDYRAALTRLTEMGVTYPCFCSRQDVARAATAHGPEGAIYPGTCRTLDAATRADRIARGDAHSIRLDVARGAAITGPLFWDERDEGRIAVDPAIGGDPVIARRDVPTSYHLSVTVDDHLQQITLVPRGRDLFLATHVQRLLQALLGFAAPLYAHHALVLDTDGQKLSKRDHATALADLRAEGWSVADVKKRIGWQDD
ncbi:tRNA glutamyl-Q(34) synthetase GluQRS [Roseiterribacter gracilis]|uniref:tRNA glutamyl-Q(34) synthetase GluQRS n=1 Tax=Roseiterribacter gracilis TaxID=2812848 RepID=A0A8S8XBS4_9PROT|nr:tRNA glutamyl-Q(34) synthetase GluQRS [Rhodospirillales bacterium TMPK1]